MRQLALTRWGRLAARLCLLGLAACQGNKGANDRHAAGEYSLQTASALTTGSDIRLVVVESGSTTLNADHTFSQREVIRIVGGASTNWSSSGTWTLAGDKLVKVHQTPRGPVTELAMLSGDTIEAGYSVLVRK